MRKTSLIRKRVRSDFYFIYFFFGFNLILCSNNINKVTQPNPKANPPITSLNQCTFKYILLKPIKIISTTLTTIKQFCKTLFFMSSFKKYINKEKKIIEIKAWPLGKLYLEADTKPGPGRALWIRCLKIVPNTIPPTMLQNAKSALRYLFL